MCEPSTLSSVPGTIFQAKARRVPPSSRRKTVFTFEPATSGKVVCHGNESSRHANADQTPRAHSDRNCGLRDKRARHGHARYSAPTYYAHRHSE
jgi:hypothetical protein